ncbi:MAG: hypothetical protein ABS62_05950 [Microbacterium sp. SCN 70-200]|uniref:DUF4126 domain-containing protein n=1 Tax=unclassified Microbacterium TaxID=2609290 RepID=UPI00086E8084|nr:MULTISPECIES: DUF4126 domain-containing protein [unclassified Microbacterium]MBN9214492.1 DUF4126 domain-containing protein [Microbacterium sp.]ODT41394.1 MAG: hypothetical protein ABS62_05950 [Microbacterium sp. SCN 70-200]OJV84126.1 MAG: hypothetical protein BGO46_14405 [Microbacterium sp. 70-16]
MLEFVVGSSLAASAGLNAWMPLFVLGILDRFLSGFDLPAGWAWLSSDTALWIVGALLVVEIVADKIPAVDSVNDVIQTVVRPASGGIAFGAGASAQAVTDPTHLFENGAWVPIVVGIVIALVVHGAKATLRPVANVATAGLAAPALSTAEDASSLALAVTAIVVPIVAGILLIALVVLIIVLLVRRRRRRAAAKASAAAP